MELLTELEPSALLDYKHKNPDGVGVIDCHRWPFRSN